VKRSSSKRLKKMITNTTEAAISLKEVKTRKRPTSLDKVRLILLERLVKRTWRFRLTRQPLTSLATSLRRCPKEIPTPECK